MESATPEELVQRLRDQSRLGRPAWEAGLPLVRAAGVSDAVAHKAVAEALRDELLKFAKHMDHDEAFALLQQVLELRSEVLTPVAAALVDRLQGITDAMCGMIAHFPGLLDHVSTHVRHRVWEYSPSHFEKALWEALDEAVHDLDSFTDAINMGNTTPEDAEKRTQARRKLLEKAVALLDGNPGRYRRVCDELMERFEATGNRRYAWLRVELWAAALDLRFPDMAQSDVCNGLLEAVTKFMICARPSPNEIFPIIDELSAIFEANEAIQDKELAKQRRGIGRPTTLQDVQEALLKRLTVYDKEGWFGRPVWRRWPVSQKVYTASIPNPMDLKEMGRLIRTGQYASMEDMLEDVRLIRDNCLQFNIGAPDTHRALHESFPNAPWVPFSVHFVRYAEDQAEALLRQLEPVVATGVGQGAHARRLRHARAVLADPRLARSVATSVVAGCGTLAQRMGSGAIASVGLRVIISLLLPTCGLELTPPFPRLRLAAAGRKPSEPKEDPKAAELHSAKAIAWDEAAPVHVWAALADISLAQVLRQRLLHAAEEEEEGGGGGGGGGEGGRPSVEEVIRRFQSAAVATPGGWSLVLAAWRGVDLEKEPELAARALTEALGPPARREHAPGIAAGAGSTPWSHLAGHRAMVEWQLPLAEVASAAATVGGQLRRARDASLQSPVEHILSGWFLPWMRALAPGAAAEQGLEQLRVPREAIPSRVAAVRAATHYEMLRVVKHLLDEGMVSAERAGAWIRDALGTLGGRQPGTRGLFGARGFAGPRELYIELSRRTGGVCWTALGLDPPLDEAGRLARAAQAARKRSEREGDATAGEGDTEGEGTQEGGAAEPPSKRARLE